MVTIINNVVEGLVKELFRMQLCSSSLVLPTFTIILVGLLFLTSWYYLFWKPFDWYSGLNEHGFEEVKHSVHARYKNESSRKETINTLMRSRRLGDIPPSYPNGWFHVLESEDLRKNEVRQVDVLGLKLVAWRGESGKSYVGDSCCPHIGVDVDNQGEIRGEIIKGCFNGLPTAGYDSELAPEFTKFRIWLTTERNGFIYLWFHAEGESPSWTPHIYAEIGTRILKYRGRLEIHTAAHIQDVSENGADLTHFSSIHADAMMSGVEPELSEGRWEFVKHVWKNCSWKRSEVEGEEHIGILRLRHELRFFGRVSLLSVDMVMKQIGPGTTVIEFDSRFGRGVLFVMNTPLETMHQKLVMRFYTNNGFIHPIAKFVLLSEAIMIGRDVRIWNRKTFVKNPLLTKEERSIKQFRQWFSQFYSENSPRSI